MKKENFVENMISALHSQIYLKQLKRKQWGNLEQLKDSQIKKLRAIVRHAYEYVPYWHRLLKNAKVRPQSIRHQDDLKKIPITTRFDIQENFPHLIAKGIDVSKQKTTLTTGSTGIPLKIVRNRLALILSDALTQYRFRETGLNPRARLVTIWGHSNRIEWGKKHSILSGHFNDTVIPTSDPDVIIGIMKQINPDAILAFPSTLTSLCNRNPSEINPKKIYTQSETVTKNCRNLIRQVFGLEVFDTYGSVEFGNLAFECEQHCGLHILTDSALIEFVDVSGANVAPGERGEAIVTGLLNYAMPLIRYRLGDLGIPTDEKCTCGRSWPLMKSIDGRANDCIILPSGKITYSMDFYHIYHKEFERNLFLISQYQLVQERRDRILFRVVRGKEFDQEALERIRINLEEHFAKKGERLEIVTQVVDEIPEERTGKKKVVVSKLL